MLSQPGNPAIADAIRLASGAYTRPQAEVARQQAQCMNDQVSDFRMTDGTEVLGFGLAGCRVDVLTALVQPLVRQGASEDATVDLARSVIVMVPA